MSVLTGPDERVFDREVVKQHRNRAAGGLDSFGFVFAQLAERLADRLSDISRDFSLALNLGSHEGLMAKTLAGRGNIKTIVQSDFSEKMVSGAPGLRVVGDEEFQPFAAECFDLILSSAILHWVNDLPGALLQARKALRPDGLLLANFFGGITLNELRICLLEAEDEIKSGVSQRVSPFTDVRDAGALLQRTGYSLAVADSDCLTVSYESPLNLLRDLRGMGETNAVIGRQKSFTSREILFRACNLYTEKFGDATGRIPATFEVITLTGWAPVADHK